MRIVFAGTPEFAAAHLQALLDDPRHQVVAVYTQPDRRAGRGKRLTASPVKMLAAQCNLPIAQPLSLKAPAAQQQLASYAADIMVVAAYGLLLPAAVLATPVHGCINVHASLLPRWRGAAPVERAIAAGDRETGVTIMQMDAGLDTGAMLLRTSCGIDACETGDSLREKLVTIGRPALLEALTQLAGQGTSAEVQDERFATYAHKLAKTEAAIDWRQAAGTIERKLRAFTSALPCYALLDSQRVKILSADLKVVATTNAASVVGEILTVDKTAIQVRCGEGALSIGRVQVPGGKAMSIAALLNGRPGFFQAGMHFTPSENP